MKRRLAGALLAVSATVPLGALGLATAAGASTTSIEPGPAAHSAGGTLAPDGPRTWHVLIGGHADGQAIQAEGYYPHVITIDAGDTVVWTLNTKEIHAVAFAGTCEDVSCIPPDCFTVNVDVSPCGPPSYDGVAALTVPAEWSPQAITGTTLSRTAGRPSP